VQQDNDQLSRSSVSCLENLILTNRPKMSNETEHTVLAFLSDIITGTFLNFTVSPFLPSVLFLLATLLPHGGALTNGDVAKPTSQSNSIVPQSTRYD